jgi:hypothetical protein
VRSPEADRLIERAELAIWLARVASKRFEAAAHALRPRAPGHERGPVGFPSASGTRRPRGAARRRQARRVGSRRGPPSGSHPEPSPEAEDLGSRRGWPLHDLLSSARCYVDALLWPSKVWAELDIAANPALYAARQNFCSARGDQGRAEP